MRHVRKVLFLTVMLLVVAATALAELPVNGTIGLYLDDSDGNDLSRAGVVKQGEPFELVVKMNSGTQPDAVIFQITELNLLYPGVFKTSTWRYNDSFMTLGQEDIGEYVFAFMECAPEGELEILRVGYNHVSGDFPNDIPLYIGGSPNTELHLPALEGAPGYVSCDHEGWALAPEPWDDDSYDPTTIAGVTETGGLLVLNPSHMVPIGSATVSTLKAKF